MSSDILKGPAQWRKMVLLGGLYITQFLGLGFIITAIPAIMRASGAGLDSIAWIYALGLIWAIKFLWAPLIDRYGSKRHGHYRGWLILLQSLMIISLVCAAFLDIGSQMPILAVFLVFASFFSATQDIATDALAVTILAPEERGLGNSIQTAGGLIGNIIGGGLVLIAYQWIGWSASLLILAAGTAIPLFTILRHKEQPAPADQRAEKVGMKDLYRFFGRPGMGRWVPVLLVYGLAISLAYALINPMLVDLGWSLDRIGFAVNIVGMLASIAGAGLAGFVVQRLGRKPAMLWTSLLVTVSIIGLYLPGSGIENTAVIYGTIMLMLLAYGANTTILATMMMDKSDPSSAGTDYTLQYSLFSILAFVASGGALVLAEAIGYTGVLTAAIAAGLITIVVVLFYNDFAPVVYTKTDQMDAPAVAPVLMSQAAED